MVKIGSNTERNLLALGQTYFAIQTRRQDFMGSTELIANLFIISQTEEKLKKDNIDTCNKAIGTHYEVGSKVRKAIEDIGGTMPEDLPRPEKSIKEIEKEQLKRLKDKKTKLMLDE